MRKSFYGKFLEKSELNSKNLPLRAPLALRSGREHLAHLVLLGEEHSGRDEMNLAGHPFALLQPPGRRNAGEPIHYEWPRQVTDGKKVTASWHVEGGQSVGMPGPNEELLYLVLLQLTREAAENADTPREWPQVVHFSRGDVLTRMGWDDSRYRFHELNQAFSRLNAVNISARWAFYDARAKSPMEQVNFHILSGVGITPEPAGRKKLGALPLSWFKWDDVLFGSLLAGNVRSLSLDFTLSLHSPTARRLFRLLELLRHAEKTPRGQIAIGTFKLRDRLGMAAYKHPSKVKEKLLAGIEELQSAGYLGEVAWEKARDGSPMAEFGFGKVGVRRMPTQAVETPQRGRMAPLTASLPVAEVAVSESPQQFAQRMSEIYAAMPEQQRLRLRDEARTAVAQEFWDRLEVPSSPIALQLWKLVEQETK